MAGRKAVIVGGRSRESTLYAQVSDGTLARHTLQPLPRIHYAHGSPLLGEYVILMEDMARIGGVGVNMIMGNQIWGVPPRLQNIADPLQVHYVLAAALMQLQFEAPTALKGKRI